MAKKRIDNRQFRGRRRNQDTPEATREDIAALMERFNVPAERLRVRNWPLFARALAREARRYALPIPHWLNYPKPATALRAVKRRPPHSASTDLSSVTTTRIRKLPSTGRGIIIVGVGTSNLIGKWKAHLDAQRAKTEPTAPKPSEPPSKDTRR